MFNVQAFLAAHRTQLVVDKEITLAKFVYGAANKTHSAMAGKQLVIGYSAKSLRNDLLIAMDQKKVHMAGIAG